MKNLANDGFTTATDFADYLVKKGLSFRDAHKKSAKLVNLQRKNMTLDQLSFKDKKIDHNTKRCIKNIKNRKFNKFKKILRWNFITKCC